MAVSYIGVSNLISTNGGAPTAITPAAATQVGDLMIFYHYSRATGGNETVTVPSGFTPVINEIVANRGLLAVAYRFEQAGDTTFTSTITNHTTGTSGETVLQWIETYRGADTASPIKATAALSNWASSLNLGPIAAPANPSMSPGDMVVVVGGRFENISAQTLLTGDGLTWAARTRIDTTLGLDAAVVTQNGLNETTSAVNVTAKTITTTGTAQTGAGVMFIIRDNTVQSISEPSGSDIVVETTRCLTNASGAVFNYFISTGTIAGATAAAGDLEIFFITVDGSSPPYPTNDIANNGLNFIDQNISGVDAAGSIYWRIRSVSSSENIIFSTLDNVLNAGGAVEGYTMVKIAVSGFDTTNPIAGSVSNNGSSTNADPPVLTLSEAKNYLWLAYAGWDNIITPSAAPSNYTMLTAPAGTNQGASTAVAYRTLNSSSENPSAFTSAVEQWVAATVAVNPINSDSQQATVLKPVTVTESATAVDDSDATVGSSVISGSVSESATATDTTDETLATSVSVSENATATDSESGVIVFPVSISESTSATDLTDETLQVSGTITEAANATDLTDETLQVIRSISEIATAVDTSDETIQTSSSISEIATATDSESGVIVFPVSISESTSATDLTDETLQVSRTITEAANATDLTDETLQVSRTITEAANATDLTDETLQVIRSISEIATATDSESGVIVFPVSISESTSATDSSNSAKTIGGTVSESATSTDSNNSTASFVRSITETATGLDSSNGVRLYQVSVTETATGSDSTNRTLGVNVSISESTSATESLNSTNSSSVSVSESASATDTISFGGQTVSASIAESTTSFDSVACTLSTSKSITESASANDSIGKTLASSVVVTESVTSSDSTDAVRIFYSVVNESGVALDAPVSFAQFSSSILETLSPLDVCDGGYKGLFKFKAWRLHTVDLEQSVNKFHTVDNDPITVGPHKINT